MKTFRSLVLVSLILLVSIACQAVGRVFSPQPTLALSGIPGGSESPVFIPTTAAPTPTISPSPTASPTATATLTPTVVPTPSALQLRIFEELWQIVRDDYLYVDYNGLDWEAIYAEYADRIQSGLTDDDFYHAMDEMIYRLGDDHSVFLSPEETSEEDAEFSGENNYVGIGILSTTVPAKKRITIIVVFPDSPAEAAGLQPHDSILAVDGHPILDESGFRHDLLRGIEGSDIVLTVQSPGEAPREVALTRQRVTGSVPVPHSLLYTTDGKRVGYVLLPTFGDETIDEQTAAMLEEFAAAGPLAGLILDNRHNSGGADTVASRVLGFFTSGVVGYFIDRDQHRRPLRAIGQDLHGSMNLPLVVLVGQDTVSFGEIFTGALRDAGRAYIIGETTDGNIELLWGYDFEDGSRAWIAHETFRPRYHPEQDWEQTGIVPDLLVPTEWDEITADSDPAVQAALDYLDMR